MPSFCLVSATSSAPSGAPCAAAVPCLLGEPKPMVVLTMMIDGRSRSSRASSGLGRDVLKRRAKVAEDAERVDRVLYRRGFRLHRARDGRGGGDGFGPEPTVGATPVGARGETAKVGESKVKATIREFIFMCEQAEKVWSHVAREKT